uniref:CIDE-N domain-containing protein n=1 Tax=Timema poppense TaxID=170557 RepID=A0A7R9H122_TIMPO|nr:unnamed protein product [Timema poppensis]
MALTLAVMPRGVSRDWTICRARPSSGVHLILYLLDGPRSRSRVFMALNCACGLRGFKVTNSGRSRTVGVACRSFDELVDKSCQKLDIPRKSVVVQLLDGTIVDDEEYFQTLPQHVLLIFLRPGENSLSGADILYNALQAVNLDFLQTGEQVKEFFSTDLKNKVRQLAQLISDSGRDERTTLLSSISQDPLWFQGLDTRAKSKEEVMFRSAQDRVRGYLYKTNDAIKKSELYKRDKELIVVYQQLLTEFLHNNIVVTDLNSVACVLYSPMQDHHVRDRLTTVMTSISTMVKEVKYFGDYFNRNADLAKKGGGDVSTQRYSADLAKEGGGHKLMHQHNADLAKKRGGDVSTHQRNTDLAKKGGGDVSTHQRNTDLAKKGGGDVSTHQHNADLAKEGGGDVSTHQCNADLAKEGGDVSTHQRNADLAKKGGGDVSTHQRNADLAKEGGDVSTHQRSADLAKKGGGDVSTHQRNADLAKEGGDVSTHQRNADLAKKGGGDVSTHQRNADLAKKGGGDVSTHQRNADLAKEGGGDVLTQRLCDYRGEFQCQGRWDRPECLYNESSRHVINPYCSKEARVLFQIWNLDHRIERSRTVVPAILEAASISVQEHRKVNCSYFFTLLFTLSNLKLVHIVCHDKGAHNVRCDPAMYFLD